MSNTKTILLIEDDLHLKETLKNSFVSTGLKVIEASESLEGVKVFKETSTDMVIIDLNSTDKNALAAILQILEIKSETKIIVLYDNIEVKSLTFMYLAKNMGAWKVIKKPVNPEAVIGLVQNYKLPM